MKKLLSRVNCIVCLMVLVAFAAPRVSAFAQASAPATAGPQKIILDTDIGDDIDDAFALALALSSHQVQLLGVTTAWGDTDLRAQLAERFLTQTGHSEIPVSVGPKTHASSIFTQARWARGFLEPAKGWPNAIDFILDTIRRNPGQVTLISIAPFSNVGALIDKDPATFRKLKRVVIMGGSIGRGYGDLGYLPNRGPSPEYNIAMDIPAAKKLFASGVPLYVMPLDSTQLKLDEVMRATLFSQGTPSTDALALLYQQWTASTLNPTPTLYDAMAVAEVIDPSICPTQPMRIQIDDRGYTRVEPGPANASVCLRSDADQFFHFYISLVLGESGSQVSKQSTPSPTALNFKAISPPRPVPSLIRMGLNQQR
jgi:inosine-uridine nucleoside N-ribohydrolase